VPSKNIVNSELLNNKFSWNISPPSESINISIEINNIPLRDKSNKKPANQIIEDPGSIKSSNKPNNKVEQTTITNNNSTEPTKQKPCKEMRKNRDKLEKNPKTLQLLRNTNTVVGITRTTKRLKVVEKLSKNRGK
jgi:hypothetical protein